MEEEYTKFHTPDSAIYLNKMNEVKAMSLLRHISSSITASSREQGPSGERETNVTVGTHWVHSTNACGNRWSAVKVDMWQTMIARMFKLFTKGVAQ